MSEKKKNKIEGEPIEWSWSSQESVQKGHLKGKEENTPDPQGLTELKEFGSSSWKRFGIGTLENKNRS